jgi:hypothetical protein
MVRLLCVVVLCLAAFPLNARAQTCNAVIENIGQNYYLSVRAANLSCTVTNGGFVYADRWYRLDIDAQVTGSCKLYSAPACTTLTDTFLRTAVGTNMYVNALHQGTVWGNNGVQSYNTCSNANCTAVGTGSQPGYNYPYYAGTYTYTTGSNTGGGTSGNGPTYCNLGGQPGNPDWFSANQPFEYHATWCRPIFNMLTDSNQNEIANIHVPATSLSLFVDSTNTTLWNKLAADATKPAQVAAAAWTTALSSKGISVTVVGTDCGTGTNCIKVDPTWTNDCATLEIPVNSQTGVQTTNATLRLNSLYNSWPNSRLQRTMAHELGHAFGLGHHPSTTGSLGYCSVNNSVMSTPVAGDCGNSPSGLAISPTIEDTLPSDKSVYGNGVRAVCGY